MKSIRGSHSHNADEQRGRTFRSQSFNCDEQCEEAESECQRGPMSLIELERQLSEAWEEVVVLERNTEDFVYLRNHQDEGCSGHITNQHGLRQKIRNRADFCARSN